MNIYNQKRFLNCSISFVQPTRLLSTSFKDRTILNVKFASYKNILTMKIQNLNNELMFSETFSALALTFLSYSWYEYHVRTIKILSTLNSIANVAMIPTALLQTALISRDNNLVCYVSRVKLNINKKRNYWVSIHSTLFFDTRIYSNLQYTLIFYKIFWK